MMRKPPSQETSLVLDEHREEILRLASQGLTYPEIALILRSRLDVHITYSQFQAYFRQHIRRDAPGKIYIHDALIRDYAAAGFTIAKITRALLAKGLPVSPQGVSYYCRRHKIPVKSKRIWKRKDAK